MTSVIPMYRHLWPHAKDSLPKKGRKADDLGGGVPELPKELQAALLSLYGNYEKYYEAWQTAADTANDGAILTPPVFIVVCNNTNVSKLVFDWIAGWEQMIGAGEDAKLVVAPGNLKLFSNVTPFTAGENRGPPSPTPSLSTQRRSSPASSSRPNSRSWWLVRSTSSKPSTVSVSPSATPRRSPRRTSFVRS